MCPLCSAAYPDSAAPEHLYRAQLRLCAEVERHQEELDELRSQTTLELGGLRAELRAVLLTHAEERGRRRVWQLIAAGVPTVAILLDLAGKMLGWFK